MVLRMGESGKAGERRDMTMERTTNLTMEISLNCSPPPQKKSRMTPRESDQDGGVRGRGTHLPPATNMLKIHLYVEQLATL